MRTQNKRWQAGNCEVNHPTNSPFWAECVMHRGVGAAEPAAQALTANTPSAGCQAGMGRSHWHHYTAGDPCRPSVGASRTHTTIPNQPLRATTAASWAVTSGSRDMLGSTHSSFTSCALNKPGEQQTDKGADGAASQHVRWQRWPVAVTLPSTAPTPHT